MFNAKAYAASSATSPLTHNETYERLAKSDVKHRCPIDMASLMSE